MAVSPLLHHGPAGEGYEAAAGHSGHGSDGGLPALPLDPAVAHMVQHLLLGMYAPLLVVLAAPLTLALGAAPLGWRPRLRAVITSRAASVLVHPVVAAFPAVVGMHVLFLTPLYRLSLEHDWLHHLVQAHLLLAGSLLALALVGGDPSPPRSGLLLRLGVLVVSAGTHAHLATLVYARAPLLPPGNPYDLVQTQQAALWMYYGGDVAEVLLAVLVCLGWYRRRARPLGRSCARGVTGPGLRQGRPVTPGRADPRPGGGRSCEHRNADGTVVGVVTHDDLTAAADGASPHRVRVRGCGCPAPPT